MRTVGVPSLGSFGEGGGDVLGRWVADGPRGRLGLFLVRVGGSSSRRREGVCVCVCVVGEQRGKGSTSQGLWTKAAEYGQLWIDIGWA